MTMPPESIRVAGAAEIGAFFATVPMEGRLERIRLRAGRANGQPGLAAYAQHETTGAHQAYGCMLFTIDGDRIAGSTGFPRRPYLLGRLGLPLEIPADGPSICP